LDDVTQPASLSPNPIPAPPPNEGRPPEFIGEDGAVEPSPVAPLPSGTKKTLRAEAIARQRSVPKNQGLLTLITAFSAARSLVIVFAVSVMVATIFASFTDNSSLSFKTRQNLAIAFSTQARADVTQTPIPTPPWFNRIGLIRGHSGIAQRNDGGTKGHPDPGAVCNDDPTLTELSVTTNVGDRVIAALRGRGYTVDALDEWDMRLVDPNKPYEAAVLLSIHADSCLNFQDGYDHSGFKVVGPEGRTTVRDQDLRLVDCLRDNYSRVTGLPHSGWSVTNNMTYYHAFREVSQRTPAAILELGFLYYDRDLLKNHPDKAAQGLVDGLMCFLDPKGQAASTASPVPNLPTRNPTFAPTLPTTPPKR
jgi:N-acetylmuramoyl-L-alanine amidase